MTTPGGGLPMPPAPPNGGGGVPGLPKPMSPLGGGPGQGLGGVPEPGGIASMFAGFTSGQVPRETLVSALQSKSAGPGGISGLLAELGGSASADGREVVFSPEHRALIKILIREHGMDSAEAIGIVAELIMNGGGAPAGGPPAGGGPPGGPGGGGPPVASLAPTIAPPIPGPGMPNLGAQTGGPA